ncbi:hypothetical protein ACVMAJ_003527 [Bradyrhizobium sp. USDA 4448]
MRHGSIVESPLIEMCGYADLNSPAPDFLRMAPELGAPRAACASRSRRMRC